MPLCLCVTAGGESCSNSSLVVVVGVCVCACVRACGVCVFVFFLSVCVLACVFFVSEKEFVRVSV